MKLDAAEFVGSLSMYQASSEKLRRIDRHLASIDIMSVPSG